jgi:hypothetical protein
MKNTRLEKQIINDTNFELSKVQFLYVMNDDKFTLENK